MNQSSAPLNTSEAMRNPLGANAMDLTLASIIDAGYLGSSGSPTGWYKRSYVSSSALYR